MWKSQIQIPFQLCSRSSVGGKQLILLNFFSLFLSWSQVGKNYNLNIIFFHEERGRWEWKTTLKAEKRKYCFLSENLFSFKPNNIEQQYRWSEKNVPSFLALELNFPSWDKKAHTQLHFLFEILRREDYVTLLKCKSTKIWLKKQIEGIKGRFATLVELFLSYSF